MIASGPRTRILNQWSSVEILKIWYFSFRWDPRCLMQENAKVLGQCNDCGFRSYGALLSAEAACRRLGYEPLFWRHAWPARRETGQLLGSIAQFHAKIAVDCIIAVAKPLSADREWKKREKSGDCTGCAKRLRDSVCAVFSLVGRTDGPTTRPVVCDAITSVFYSEGNHVDKVLCATIRIRARAKRRLFHGPTGTNVNDLYIVLIKRE
jgi:hypothetical protein